MEGYNWKITTLSLLAIITVLAVILGLVRSSFAAASMTVIATLLACLFIYLRRARGEIIVLLMLCLALAILAVTYVMAVAVVRWWKCDLQATGTIINQSSEPMPMPVTNHPGKRVLASAAFGLLLILAFTACSRAPQDIRKVGGYVLVYEMDPPPPGSTEPMVRALEKRLRQFGFRDATVSLLDDKLVEIALAGADQAAMEKAKRVVTIAGVLEFRILAKPGPDDEAIAAATTAEGEASPANETTKKTRWVSYDAKSLQLPAEAVTREVEGLGSQVLVLLDSWNLSGADLKTVSRSVDANGTPSIAGSLTPKGTRLLEAMTSQNLPDAQGRARALGILLDNHLISAPRILARIGEHFQITGNFSGEEVDFLVGVLRTGTLPARLKAEPVKTERIVAGE